MRHPTRDARDLPLPIFRQVFARLREDDSILAMSDTEFLEVELSQPLTEHGVDDLTPTGLRHHAAVFVRQLHEVAKKVAGEPYLPDMRNPNGLCRFKKGEDAVVAFHGDSPVWHWRRKGGLWELHMMRVTRVSNVVGASDIEALLAGLESLDDEHDEAGVRAARFQNGSGQEGIEDIDGSSDGGLETSDMAAGEGNDPERLTPDALLGVLMHFNQVLKDAHDRLDDAPWLPDTADPNGEGRFRSNGEYIVAYRSGDGAEYVPDWCWRKKPDGSWKLYRLRSRAGPDIPDPSFERRLRDGRWT